MTAPFYVSITGLRIKRVWHVPAFYRHAIASMTQLQQADGCIAAEARTIAGIHHTRSVWKSRAHMRNALYTGAHAKAIKAFRTIATGKTFGYETDAIPDWDEVHSLWQTKGRDYS